MDEHSELTRALERCDRARREAQELLAVFLAPRLRYILGGLGKTPQVREELFQQIMLQVLEDFNFFVAPDDWYRRLRNHVRDAAKSFTARSGRERVAMETFQHEARKVREEQAKRERHRVETPDFDEIAARRALEELDLQRLVRLSASQAVTMLLVAGGIKQSEVALARGCSAPTISRELDKAKKAYRDLCGGEDDGGS